MLWGGVSLSDLGLWGFWKALLDLLLPDSGRVSPAGPAHARQWACLHLRPLWNSFTPDLGEAGTQGAPPRLGRACTLPSWVSLGCDSDFSGRGFLPCDTVNACTSRARRGSGRCTRVAWGTSAGTEQGLGAVPILPASPLLSPACCPRHLIRPQWLRPPFAWSLAPAQDLACGTGRSPLDVSPGGALPRPAQLWAGHVTHCRSTDQVGAAEASAGTWLTPQKGTRVPGPAPKAHR